MLCPKCKLELTRCDDDCCGGTVYCHKCGLEESEIEDIILAQYHGEDIIKAENGEVEAFEINDVDELFVEPEEEYYLEKCRNGDIELWKVDGTFYDHDTQDLLIAVFYEVKFAEKVCNILNKKEA